MAAAEGCLAPDTVGWQQYRARREELGMNTGEVPLPSDLARRVAAHMEEAAARRAAHAILDRPGALDDPAAAAEAADLMAIADQAAAGAGGMIRIGNVTYGL